MFFEGLGSAIYCHTGLFSERFLFERITVSYLEEDSSELTFPFVLTSE